jgi:hypothetical protein
MPSELLNFRVTAAQGKRIRANAKAAGLSFSAYIRRELLGEIGGPKAKPGAPTLQDPEPTKDDPISVQTKHELRRLTEQLERK